MTEFSERTTWPREPNRLALLLEERRQSGKPIIDLTISNPTACGIVYPADAILKALAQPQALQYSPDPRGLLPAREAVAQYYRSVGVALDPAQILLTAGTSEAYAHLFTLLCNPGERVLVPRPSYPLFDYLASLTGAALGHYRLSYDSGWSIDIDSLLASIDAATRAIVLVHPHNPTGHTFTPDDFRQIVDLAKSHRLALIVDEVFIEYLGADNRTALATTAGNTEVLTFTLNGLSKMAGLPQMKLGWIVACGPSGAREEALSRLEIVADTFLSVNTPVQAALPALLEAGCSIRSAIRLRIRENLETLESAVRGTSCSLLNSGGGWYAVIAVPRTLPEEEWAIQILQKTGVYLYPGYFFDLEEEGYLVISLLARPEEFQEACSKVFRQIDGN